MSRPDVEVVLRSNALSAAGDWAAALELLAPDVEWVVARDHPEARTLLGREAVREYLRGWEQATPGFQVRLERVIEAGGRVLGIGTAGGTGSGSGAAVSIPIAILFTVRGRLIARAEEYLDPHEAMRVAGLA